MSEAKPSSFGARLRQLREAKGLSQESLAKLAGMHRFGVAKLERGEREPSWATVRALTKALGISCSAFESGEEKKAEEALRPKGRPRKQETGGERTPSARKGRKRKEKER